MPRPGRRLASAVKDGRRPARRAGQARPARAGPHAVLGTQIKIAQLSRCAGTALSRPLRRVGPARGHRAKGGCRPSDAIGYRRPDLYGQAVGKRSLAPKAVDLAWGCGHRAGLRDLLTPKTRAVAAPRVTASHRQSSQWAAAGLAGERDQQKPMEKLFGAAAALAEVLR